ncbi:MAG: GNAT family N-acetyltransferase [Gammaproteobacteria bacterium]|nr:GNAT family N-acetyltransferase [Gammaproteobacteria bacterium]
MLETDRLRLRQWIDADIEPFIALNQDKRVMRYFPNLYSEAETRNMISLCQKSIDENGWGFWAVDLKSTQEFIGMVGLNRIPDDIPLDDTLEVGWRLASPYWGKGYATEAARASLDYAFTTLNSECVVAFTAKDNHPSRRVMERLGMKKRLEGFFHPRLEQDHPLGEHVVYDITQSRFVETDYSKPDTTETV